MKQYFKTKNGFTLVELVLYITITSIILLSISTLISFIVESGIKNKAILEVEQQGAQINQIITQTINNSSTIIEPVNYAQSETLSMLSINNESISFSIENLALVLNENSQETTLNNSNINISALNFQNTATNSIKFYFTVTYNNDSGRNEYNYSKTFYGSASVKTQTIPSVGDWTNPIVETYLDLTTNHGQAKIFVNGNYAYIINDQASENFMIVNLTTLEITKIDLPYIPSNIFIYKNYAYITLNSDIKDLIIIDLSNPTNLDNIHQFNAPYDTSAIYIKDNIAYIISPNQKFVALNVENPLAPTRLALKTIPGYDIYISGDYGYILSIENGKDLVIFNLADLINSNETNSVGSFDIPENNVSYSSIVITGDTAMVNHGPQIYTIDISDKTQPTGIGNIDVGGEIFDIATNLGNMNSYCFVVKDNGELTIVDISNPTEPITIGNLGIEVNQGFAVYYSKTLDKAFTINSVNGSGSFVVIKPTAI